MVNIHLSQYGVYSLSLLQSNYITAGIWTLLPILLAVLAVSAAFSLYYQFFEKKKDENNAEPESEKNKG